MVTETLQVNILAKIRDFEKKMGVVDKKINSMQKGSIAASKTVDKMLSTKATGTTAAVDLVNKKLAQVNRTAASTRKALSGKMMFSADSSGIDLQKVKLDQLKQKYDDLTSGVRVPVALKTMDKEYSQLGTQIDAAKAKQAALNAEIEQLKWNEMASAGSGNIVGAEGYHAQIISAKAEMGTLVASTSELEARASALSSKMQTIRMNPSASPEAQLLAAQIKAADAKMEKLGTDTTKTTGKIAGLRSGGGALDAINRKISSLEKSSNRTANAVSKLGRRFMVLFVGKLITQAFKGISDSLVGAATKSEQLQNSLNTLSSAGRTISNTVVAALAPLISVAAPMIDYISQKIMDFGNSVAMFFAAISGQDTVLQATKAYSGFGAAAEGAGDSAAAGAEKAKNALAGFDQITKLDTSTSSSGSGGTGTGTKTAEGATSYVTVPVVQSDLAKKVAGAIEKLKGPLSEFYENVLKPIGAWIMGPGIDFLATALTTVADFVDEHPTLTGVLLGIVGALLALKAVGAFGLAVNATVTGLSALSPLLAKAGIIGLTVVVSLAVGTLLGTILGDYMVSKSSNGELLVVSMRVNPDGMTSWYEQMWNYLGLLFTNFAANFALALGSIIDPIVNYFLEPVIAMINGIRTSFGLDPVEYTFEFAPGAHEWKDQFLADIEEANKVWEDSFPFKGEMSGIEGLKDSFGGMPTAVQNAMAAATLALKNGTRDQSRTYQDYLYGLTSKTGASYGLLTSTVDLGTKNAAKYMQTNIGAGVQGVNDSFGGMPTSVQAQLAGLNNTVWGGMNTVSGTLAERTAGGVGAVLGSYAGMPSSVQAHMAALASNVGGGANSAVQALYDNTNRGINDTMPAWSHFSNDGTTKITTFAENVRLAMETVLRNMARLPSTAAEARGFSGLTSGFLEGIHRLPMFAQGGVVNSATAAILGESGKEVVMPLERNTGWIDNLADKINKRGGGGGDIYLTVQNVVDGRVISEQVTKIQKRDARRSNKPVWGNA